MATNKTLSVWIIRKEIVTITWWLNKIAKKIDTLLGGKHKTAKEMHVCFGRSTKQPSKYILFLAVYKNSQGNAHLPWPCIRTVKEICNFLGCLQCKDHHEITFSQLFASTAKENAIYLGGFNLPPRKSVATKAIPVWCSARTRMYISI